MGFLTPKIPKEDPAAILRREQAEKRAASERLDTTQSDLLRLTQFRNRIFGSRAGLSGSRAVSFGGGGAAGGGSGGGSGGGFGGGGFGGGFGGFGRAR